MPSHPFARRQRRSALSNQQRTEWYQRETTRREVATAEQTNEERSIRIDARAANRHSYYLAHRTPDTLASNITFETSVQQLEAALAAAGYDDPLHSSSDSESEESDHDQQSLCSQLSEQQESGSDANISTAHTEARFFSDMEQIPAKSVMLFYINSGYLRFQQYKDYDAAFNNQPIDLAKVASDIQAEALSVEELDGVVRKFYDVHPFVDFMIQGCSACGIRLIERCDDPCVQFVRVSLSSPNMSILMFSADQTRDLRQFMESPQAVVSLPIAVDWTMQTVNLAHARSFYEQQLPDGSSHLWHLHPELVDHHIDGDLSAVLCPDCHHAIVSNHAIPKLSIAKGVDFGYHKRLGLTMPNLHEQLIIARTRLYFAMIKISSNTRGQTNMNKDNKARCHAILFPHNSSDVASYMFGADLFGKGGLLDVDELKKLLSLYMVDPKGRLDAIAQEIFRTVNLLGRPFVVAQWLITLKWCNPHYHDLDVSRIMEKVAGVIELVNKHVMENAAAIDEPDAVAFEDSLGSDVANVRNQEVHDEIAEVVTQERTATPNNRIFEDISYSYITNSDNAYYNLDEGDYRLQALKKLADLPLQGPSAPQDHDCCLFNSDDIHAYLHQYPPSGNAATARSEFPLSDFDNLDKGLGTSFPHIFMLGTAYKKSPGGLSSAQRSHLLNQFHSVPSKDRRLMGFLFDVRQRQKVMLGVKAHVQSNKRALGIFGSLLNNKEDQQRLQTAIRLPYTTEAKRTLKKYLSHLQFSSKDISYGTLEGSKLKHRLLGSCYRYSAPTCFLTISPGTIDNPRSIRLACSIDSNHEFPSTFEKDCPYGRNGAEFVDRMGSSVATLSEATITLPRARRAEMAIDNPVAFVLEYKVLLNDIICILLKSSIEDKGFFSRTSSTSSRRTLYYKLKKGIFGHTFAVSGVTEAHERGTLHWHFTLHAGLSPYVLQRFAHLQEMCDEISKVLDDMYVSHVPPDLQAGGLLRRFLKGRRGPWNIHDDVTASIEPAETLIGRKNPLQKLCVPCHQGSIVDRSGVDQTQEFQQDPIQHHDASSLAGSTREGNFSPDPSSHRHEESLSSTTTQPVPAVTQDSDDDVSHERNSMDAQTSLFGDDNSETGSDNLGVPVFCEPEPSDFRMYVSLRKVMRDVSYQGTCSNFHIHQFTCHKGSQGKIGCRLCCPLAVQSTTFAVKLVPLREDSDDNEEDRPRRWHPTMPDDSFHDRSVPKHHLVDLLEQKMEKSVIVWETRRPTILLPCFYENPLKKEDPRAFVVDTFQSLLRDVPCFGSDNTCFWDWMKVTATVDNLLEAFFHVRDTLPASNGFIAAFNPILALCTGCHNNSSLLGSLTQAKSALFYLIPYQGKTKFPLMGCLTIIDHALTHLEKYKSTAADSGTQERTVKHLLTRVVNRIHLQMEISDYQVAASLLEVPSMIMSDKFAYGRPLSLVILRAHLSHGPDREASLLRLSEAIGNNTIPQSQTNPTLNALVDDDLDWGEYAGGGGAVQEDQEPSQVEQEDTHLLEAAVTASDVSYGMGYIQKVYIVLPVKGEKGSGTPVFLPASALYLYRGEALADLNYYEYTALVQFVNKCPRKTAVVPRDRQIHFGMHPLFPAVEVSYHVLRAKQHTPLQIGETPRHPGKMPTTLYGRVACNWLIKANFYARYYLCLFRAENIDSGFSYTWGDLVLFISSLQNSPSAIDKFRLMAMHQHMSGMKVSESVKKMTLQFRGRARTLWTKAQRSAFEKWNVHQSPVLKKYSVGDTDFPAPFLSQATMTIMTKRLSHDRYQIAAVKGAFAGTIQRGSLAYTKTGIAVEELADKFDSMVTWKTPLQDTHNQDMSQTGLGATVTASGLAGIIANLRGALLGDSLQETQQVVLFDAFANYLLSSSDLPSTILVHGPPGVGKSFLRKQVSKAIAAAGRYNDNTAFNSINAIDMKNGLTTCMDTGFDCAAHFDAIGTFTPATLQKAKERLGRYASIDTFNNVDEIGTQAPAHLARKSALCKLLSNSEENFGARHTVLYGDLTQLGPVKAGMNLTQAIMDIYASDAIRSSIIMPGKKRKCSKKRKRNSLVPSDMYGATHPFYIGATLFTEVRWFELTKQVRSSDIEHNAIIKRLYSGLPVSQPDIKAKYKLLDPEESISREWCEASVLVATNRERYTLIEERALAFARLNGTHVIRWYREWKNWEQEPVGAMAHDAMQDPVFWEHFVVDGKGFINRTIQKDLLLVNALEVRYHAIQFGREHEDLLQHLLQTVPPGGMIDMPVPPSSIIVEVFLPADASDDVLDELHSLSLDRPTIGAPRHSNALLLPIQPASCQWNKNPTVIRGGNSFLPSRAKFRNLFPLELAFAITVHKSQGRTMHRVIIALSDCGVGACRFTFSQLLVAFSRVQHGDHIRLLLTGATEEDKWRSIIFVNRLRRDPSIAYFFAGFRIPTDDDINKGWMEDQWSQDRANARFQHMVQTGVF
jgi:hypothetical protein